MCLIAFAWRPEHAVPLVVAANRDEFYARPTLPLAAWEDVPAVIAGRDLQAGGSWLGLGPDGRFAALTNIRDPGQAPGRRSRGELVAQFLTGGMSIDDYLLEVRSRVREYAGFNLLLGCVAPSHEARRKDPLAGNAPAQRGSTASVEAESCTAVGERPDHHARQTPPPPRLVYFNSALEQPVDLAAGVYGLSNASLDTPWPKLLQARASLAAHLDAPHAHPLLAFLADPGQAAEAQLPDTGVGLATEKLLSSVFIASPTYGTRASTVVIINADGTRQITERSFGPYGGHLGEVSLEC